MTPELKEKFNPKRHSIEFIGFTEEEIYEITLSEKPSIMRHNIIYISGKITGTPNLNRHKFAAATEHCKKFASVVINPHTLPDNHDKSWFSYMKACIKALCNAEMVVVLDDWKLSRGAIREVMIAKWLDIPVVSIEDMKEVKISFLMKVKLLLNLI